MPCFLRILAISSKCRDTFNHPEHGERAEERSRGNVSPARQRVPRQPKKGSETEHHGNEEELTDFHADIKEKKRGRDVTGGESNLAQRTGEAEAVEEPEGESDHPGGADGDTGLALAGADDLKRDEGDRQRDRRLDRRRAH